MTNHVNAQFIIQRFQCDTVDTGQIDPNTGRPIYRLKTDQEMQNDAIERGLGLQMAYRQHVADLENAWRRKG